MQPLSNKYYLSALEYLKNYYQVFADESFYFGYNFIKGLVDEGEKIARSQDLENMPLQNALLVVSFRFAGVSNFLEENDTKYQLLHDFADQVNYPREDLITVEHSIHNVSNFIQPSGRIEMVAWDAINARFVLDDLVVQLSFLKEEMNRINETKYSELQILAAFKDKFSKWNYYTDFAKQHYNEKKEKNFVKLTKRIQKLQENEIKSKKENKISTNISAKETGDLFKTAFRNYSQLISVADSKAGLLIHVNSLIVSIVLGFVISRSDKYPYLIIPSIVLLSVSFLTICLSILASRPQRNSTVNDKNSSTYQTFFFGSFDMIGKDFLKANWGEYFNELETLLNGDKQQILKEVYKEAYNTRKVLSKKFVYLSAAYWIFLIGLFVSIIIFFISTCAKY